MLNIICGEPGSGKTVRMLEELKKSAESGVKTFLFVPDQFSFEAEKQIYRTVEHKYSQNVTVTTFSRCAAQILRTYGETKEYADDMAKYILMKRALGEAAADVALVFYGKQAKKRGFPAFALSVISELRSAGVSESELRKKVNSCTGLPDRLMKKLSDISVIYSGYDALLTRRFDDRLDDIRRAAQIIGRSDMFDDADVYFEGFDSFSGNQYGFINVLIKKARNTFFTFTTDDPDSRDRKYRGVRGVIGKLTLAADNERNVIKLGGSYRKPDEVRIVEAADMWQECDWICAMIRKLADEGMLYRETAVLTPGGSYPQILSSAMKKYGIPCFTDIPEPIITKSFARFALYTLKALSFETEDILRYVKCGYVRHSDSGKSISNSQLDELEKLCHAYDIRKRDWLAPFPEELKNSGDLEALRKSIIEPLTELKSVLAGEDGAAMTKALCRFICDTMDINKTIYGKCIIERDDKGTPTIDNVKMAEYSSIWNDVVDIFESAYVSLKDYFPTIEEYTDILTDIFTSVTAAKPPQVLDAVTVGDTLRSRFTRIRAVFICGFAQGVMPPPEHMSEAFSGSESEKLTDIGIPIGSDRVSRSSYELFTVHRCVGLPEEKLFLTYPIQDEAQDRLEPSPHLKKLSERFGAGIEFAGSYDAAFYCRTPDAAKRYLAGVYLDREKAAERAALSDALPPEYTLLLAYAAGETENTERHIVEREQAKPLLGLERYSATVFADLNDCKFRYFCKTGLELKENRERKIDYSLSGTVIHYCLRRLFENCRENGTDFGSVTDEQIRESVDAGVKEFEENTYHGLGGSGRFSYLLRRLGVYAERAAKRSRDEIKVSRFLPSEFEKEFSLPFGKTEIKGICDRIDRLTAGGTTYMRIVDYKRSEKTLTLPDVYKGDKLQMFLYMFTLCKEPEKPSSMMYIPVGKENLEPSSIPDTEKAAASSERKYLMSHFPRGAVLTDSPEKEAIDEINRQMKELYPSVRNDFLKHEDITPDAFGRIEAYCKEYVNSKISEAVNGMASACPADEGRCRYCDFALFCGRKAVRKEYDDEEEEEDYDETEEEE